MQIIWVRAKKEARSPTKSREETRMLGPGTGLLPGKVWFQARELLAKIPSTGPNMGSITNLDPFLGRRAPFKLISRIQEVSAKLQESYLNSRILTKPLW